MDSYNFRFRRGIRTASSEQYDIYYMNENIGELHIQFMKDNSDEICNLIITKDISITVKEELIEEIINTIISNPEDFFVINIFIGNFEGSVINTPHPDGMAAKQKDLSKFLNTYQVAKGQLAEGAAIDFFKSMNYQAEEAPPNYDQDFKIDILAENEEEKLYIQVKLGMIADKEIGKVVKNVSMLEDTNKNKVVCIVAERFPVKAENLRRTLEEQYGMKIMYIHKYQILENSPKYKRTLK
ncbi:restriction endonuclease [Bacillus mycoides]|uniref:restriction endonuclease n=1 Tax=Bacillus mycoides TaxID=1405 RepID=UPI001C0216D0|nr:restriction endonuclease [Bacillus mycoides]QWH50392.1 hypothetical protein EXW44_09325 [Bacillus mycoides]QWJ02484.1 hypothetical protein J5V93_09115 [Bacillus mycoides]